MIPRLSSLLDLPTVLSTVSRPVAYLRARRSRAREEKYDVPLRSGHVIRLRGRSRDFHVFHRIFINDEYGLRGLDFDGARVVDIGAHAGFFALRAAIAGARVLCVEPAPDNIRLLRHNIERNGLEDRIDVCEKAVCGESGPVELCRDGDPYAHSIRSDSSGEGNGSDVIVEATTLGALLDAYDIAECALLKLDCEGCEYEILQNASPDVLRRCERIRLEYHIDPAAPGAPEALRRHLEETGFTIEAMQTKKRGHQGYLFCRRA